MCNYYQQCVLLCFFQWLGWATFSCITAFSLILFSSFFFPKIFLALEIKSFSVQFLYWYWPVVCHLALPGSTDFWSIAVTSATDFRDFLSCVPYQQTGIADLCQTSSISVTAGTHSFLEFNFLVFKWRAKRKRQKHLQDAALQRDCLPLWQEWWMFFLFFRAV